MRIMVVDDEPLIGQYIAQCIREADDAAELVGVVTSGAKALKALETETVDLVFADVTMPKMDGIELLRRIKQAYPSVNVIMLTCHDDFGYVRAAMQNQAADYILKNEVSPALIRTLLERLYASKKEELAQGEERRISRNSYLRRVLENDPAVLPIRESELRANHIYLENRAFVALCFRSEEENLHVMQEMQADGFENPLFYAYSEKEMLLLMNLCRSEEARAEELFARYGSRMTDVVGRSRVHHHLEGLQAALFEAVADRDHAFYRSAERAADPKVALAQINQHIMRALVRIGDGDLHGGCNEIERLLIAAERGRPPVTALKDAVGQLLAGIQSKTGLTLSTAGQIERSRSFAEMEADVQEVLTILRGQGRLYSAPIRKALDYIGFHFAEDISLNLVADFVYLNRDYLSRQFKKEVGVNFSEYLMNLRMQRARQLLETTNLRISDVAMSVGITNLSYFSTVFHKAFGCKPNELRKKSQQKE